MNVKAFIALAILTNFISLFDMATKRLFIRRVKFLCFFPVRIPITSKKITHILLSASRRTAYPLRARDYYKGLSTLLAVSANLTTQFLANQFVPTFLRASVFCLFPRWVSREQFLTDYTYFFNWHKTKIPFRLRLVSAILFKVGRSMRNGICQWGINPLKPISLLYHGVS